MTPDELRALADALEPMARAPRFEDCDVPGFCAWVRACADAKPVAWMHDGFVSTDYERVQHDEMRNRSCGFKAKPILALYSHPAPASPQAEPMPKGKPSFVQQIENSRENVKAWPQWMQDATVESAATMPKFPTPQPERQPVSEPTDAHPMLCATHYCKDCAALWRQCDDFSFTLRSQACCTACNNAPVGGQLFALTTPVAMPRPSDPTDEQIEQERSDE